MDPRQTRKARRALVERRAAERDAAGHNTPVRVRWRKLRRRLGHWLLELCAPILLRLLAATWRVQRHGDAGFVRLRSDAPWIVAMWHGRMLALMPLRFHRHRGIGVLVSPSDDGGLATVALHRFGYRVVRGSLSRGGARALRTLRAAVGNGGQLVLTPDGPRGPRHTMNVGATWLARETGAAILPVGIACNRAWRLSSWDRFLIPKPFARLVIVYGEPWPVPADTSDSNLEVLSAALQQALLDCESLGFARLGIPPDFAMAPAAAGRPPGPPCQAGGPEKQPGPDTALDAGPGP